MQYLALILSAAFVACFCLLLWAVLTAPLDPEQPHNTEPTKGPDGTTDNGTKS